MEICKICKKECKNFIGLVSHIQNHNISSKEYYDKYLKKEDEGVCLECNKETNFKTITSGYYNYCSRDCSRKSYLVREKTKNTFIKKYGINNPNKLEEVRDKIKKTNIEKYGGIGFQSEEITNKQRQTCLEKYGTKNIQELDSIKEKRKKTNIEKFGCENVFQNEEIKEKIIETNIKKYSVENVSQNSEILNKKKNTWLLKYCVDNPNKNKEIKEKSKKTCLEKYGGIGFQVENKEIRERIKQTNLEKYGYKTPLQNKEIKEKIKQKWILKYGVDNPNKNKEIQNKIKQTNLNNFLPKVNELIKNLNLEILSDYNNNMELIKVKCKTCNNIFETLYFNLHQGCGKCPTCFPKYKSIPEIELLNFIKLIESSEIIENDRNILNGKELDIYIPSKNIAIEFDGLYYHNELFKNKNYHLNKTELCFSKNIQLIHIFEDEWLFKQDIVKSRLKQILQLNNIPKIHARKCEIKEILPKIKNEFLDKHHIQGKDNSSIKLGAFYNDELVSLMTFSHGNISKGSKNIKDIYELSRFCSNNNYHIPGIASKLLSYFKKNYEWKEIYSYADRRWSQGNLYYKLGFELSRITKPNYFYIKEQKRIHRFGFRKRPDEPKDVTELELRAREGYFPIYDCGNIKFIIKNKKNN